MTQTQNNLAGNADKPLLFHLRNSKGNSVVITNFGARIMAINLSVNGKARNIVLGHDDPSDYIKDPFYLGAVTGRYSNRIANSQFVGVNGSIILLDANEPPHHLHGGSEGFQNQIWHARYASEGQLVLDHTSPDGTMGYPGTIQATVTYSFDDENTLKIGFHATSDAACPLNLTSHSYYNLDGQHGPEATILGHQLQINALAYTPVDERQIPLGTTEVLPADLNFWDAKQIGEDIGGKSAPGGIDHNYIFHNEKHTVIHAATLTSTSGDLSMQMETDYPAMQCYSGQYLKEPFNAFAGMCLEPQYAPDAPNQKGFETPVVAPGKPYNHEITLRFHGAD